MIEFRWIIPDTTCTDGPKLQYRETKTNEFGHYYGTEWKTVPLVVVDNAEYRKAKP